MDLDVRAVRTERIVLDGPCAEKTLGFESSPSVLTQTRDARA